MSCSNFFYLRCCTNPTIVIQPCTPTVNGTSNSTFVVGQTYTTTDGTYGTLCWEAFNTHTGGVLTYTLSNSFTSYSGGLGTDCDACTYEHGGGCITPPTTFVPAILTSCCDEVTTLDVNVPSTASVGQAIAINGECWEITSLSGSGGDNYMIGFDNCTVCESSYPCPTYANKYFVSCCFGLSDPDPVYKTFEVNTAAFQIAISSVVYSGDGLCYAYLGTNSFNTPAQTFLSPYTNDVSQGACGACTESNTTECVYTFTDCCDGSTFSFRRGDVEMSTDYVDNSTFSISYYGVGGSYVGCATATTGFTGDTLYIDTNPTFSYVLTAGCDDSGNCPSCPSPTPTITPTTTPTPTITPNASPSPTPTQTKTPTPTVTPTVTPSTGAFGNGGIFDYFLNVTGACQTGLGSVLITASGGIPPYTFDWFNPELGLGNYKTGLPSGVYNVRANDSTVPVNNEFYINITVSGCLCVSILGVESTTCGLDNGTITATSDSSFSVVTYSLYNIGDEIINQIDSNTGQVIFTSLSAGTYYLVATDGGGGEGTSQTFIVEDSTELDFGLYVVPNASCGTGNIGKLYVTGQTGTPPYSYLWSNGSLASSISGLTAGVYSVEVTDFYGCKKTETGEIVNLAPVGLGGITTVNPTCYNNNGSLTFIITGGTAPYYYSASTGTVDISYSTEFTLLNLSNGQYQIQVTDAALCKFVASTTINSSYGITSVNVTTQNSYCSLTDGEITVNIVGGVTPYTITLVDSDGNSDIVTGNQTQEVFSNLLGGTYTVFVEDNGGCLYTQSVTILTQDKFDVTIGVNNSTCNNPYGEVDIYVGSGYETPLTYSIDGIINITDTILSSVTFNNISVGQHTVTVTDGSGCAITKAFSVDSTPPVNFSLYSTSCGTGSQGTITAFISSGIPPFNFYWSDNVLGNPQQISVSGLTGGTYTLIVEDSNGCSLVRGTEIDCDKVYTSVQSYTMGADLFDIISPTKCGINQILVDGYYDLTSGNTDCILTQATYTAKVQIQPQNTVITNTFYTGTTLVDVPSDNLWYTTIQNLLQSISGIVSVVVNPSTNQITIKSNPGSGISTQEVIVELIIEYDIDCLS